MEVRGFFLFLGLLAMRTWAQSPCAFDLGADTTICPGASLVLSAPAGMASYAWNTGATTPSITVATPGTYWCTVTQVETIGAELIVNGDFSDGLNGFTSDYIVPTVPGVYGLLSDEGQYIVTTSPDLGHVDFSSCGDHSSGSGNMMVVNGAATPGVNVWCQDVAVQPGTDYTFSAWLTTVFPANPATLGFSINGVSLGAPLAASDTPCEWDQFATTWNSGTATSATVCIENLNTEIFGNDFALDDISFVGGSEGCTHTDSIAVDISEADLDLGADVFLCPGGELELEADATDLLWNTGASTPAITVSAPGDYWAAATVDGCTVSDTVQVAEYPALPPPLPLDTLISCPGVDIELHAPVDTGLTYLWSVGASTPSVTVNMPGIYLVTLANACTQRTDTILVLEDDCSVAVHVPNAVTPDGDGINDVFAPVVMGMLSLYEFEIYNRWGELIHQTTEPLVAWDATYRGQPVPIGVYVWKLRYQPFASVSYRDVFGHVTVVR